MGTLLAFQVTWQHPIRNAKQQGRKMPPSGNCLPPSLMLY
jgi:hypothetical protein